MPQRPWFKTCPGTSVIFRYLSHFNQHLGQLSLLSPRDSKMSTSLRAERQQ